MSLFGPYTGDSSKAYSYQIGSHWGGKIGYRVVEGFDSYRHFFGGESWKLPTCPKCNENLHQIFTFDLSDPRLVILKVNNLRELPLVSCLNCSYHWESQTFKLDYLKKEVTIINQIDLHNWQSDDEDKIPSTMTRTDVKIIDMLNGDIPIDDESYATAFEFFGEEYLCRLLGSPLYANGPIDRECPCCLREMIYVSTVTGENYGNESNLISTVDFVIGESYIYFLFCKSCLLIKTELQSS